uniref:Uncharacterized protein n=1 Tax=Bactrocera dorsalis TaxID=27457 RepID=A0A034W4N1_BACDO
MMQANKFVLDNMHVVVIFVVVKHFSQCICNSAAFARQIGLDAATSTNAHTYTHVGTEKCHNYCTNLVGELKLILPPLHVAHTSPNAAFGLAYFLIDLEICFVVIVF